MLERYLPRTEFDSYEDFRDNYTLDIPENFNFGFDVVDEWARLDKEKLALLWCDDHGDEKTLTFEEIRRMSNQTANFLKSIGVKKGTIVMLILRRRWEYWVCATALHKIGAILIPGSTLLTSKDIDYRANVAGIDTVICVDEEFIVSQIEGAKGSIPVRNFIIVNGRRGGWLPFEDSVSKFSEEFERVPGEIKNEDTMLIYFTSGTTGMPKMVMHNFIHPLGQIVTARYWQRVEDGKLHMSVSDSGWAKFGWGKIYGQWICGAVIFAYDMDKFVPRLLLEKMEKYRLTTFCAPPTMYRFILQEDVSKYDLSSIKRYCIAGEPLNPEVFKQWEQLTGVKITEGFGQSESTVIIANFEWFEPRPGSTGKPSPLYHIELINDEGELCEDGEEGQIVVMDIDKRMPPGLFFGYYRDESLTEKSLGGRYYNLGDVAWRDSDGYYWFVGRHDDVIKCSGYRIGPFEVESALVEHPAVVECAITAAPDPVRGQVVKATVVLAAGYSPSDELVRELQDHVKKVTAPYKYPRIIEFADELPKTSSGKIKRNEIRNESNK
jgi:acetyl-CoA synthetase